MKIKLILLFVLFYLGALLITLPADKVVRFIPDNAGITVTAVSGSLWDGQAAQLTYKKQFQLQKLDWKIDWLAVTRLQLKLDIKFTDGMHAMSGKGSVLLGFSGISIEDLIVDSSAPELLAYISLPVPVEVSGELSLRIKNAVQGRPYCQQLDGYIDWKNAKINSDMGGVDLDSTHIGLSCDKGLLVADLKQHSEQLTTTANFLLKEKGVYQLRALLKAGDKLEPAIKDALSWIGSKNKSGETVVKFDGKL